MKYKDNIILKLVIILGIGFILIKFLPGLFLVLLLLYGFYTLLYLVGIFIKSAAPLSAILSLIAFVPIGLGYLGVLYLYYIALKMLFEGNFLFGLILILIGIPIFGNIPTIMGFLGALILTGPAMYFVEDLEKRFAKKLEPLEPIDY